MHSPRLCLQNRWKKSRNGDTLGVELNVGLEQGNQGDQGDRREQDDQGEVSIIMFGMSKSSGGKILVHAKDPRILES